MKKVLTVALGAICLIGVVGCESDADKVSKNVSKAAEQFEVQRKIIGINGITDKVLFSVEGKCSLELGESLASTLDVICKHGPNSYKKHFVGLSDNVTFIAVQVDGIDADEYRTRIIIKPENIVPNLDLVTGE
jgi:hypothetical protein